MAWERQPDGKFSEKQRKKIMAMVESGKTQVEVAEIVGCDASSISLMLKAAKKKAKKKPAKRKLVKRKPTKKKSKKPAKRPPRKPAKKQARVDGERAYLQWALRGALSKVKGVSFVDRLIMDIANDRLTELD